MSSFKTVYIVLFLMTAIPALGYVRYLYDEEENQGGALIVLLFVLITGIALWKGAY